MALSHPAVALHVLRQAQQAQQAQQDDNLEYILRCLEMVQGACPYRWVWVPGQGLGLGPALGCLAAAGLLFPSASCEGVVSMQRLLCPSHLAKAAALASLVPGTC
jgi:hypothetical protein